MLSSLPTLRHVQPVWESVLLTRPGPEGTVVPQTPAPSAQGVVFLPCCSGLGVACTHTVPSLAEGSSAKCQGRGKLAGHALSMQ